jgi:hypothetical protein
MLAFYPHFFWETLRAHFWMAYWLLWMNAMRRRVNRDGWRSAYTDLALETGAADELDTLALFKTTRGGHQAVVKRRSEGAARDKAKVNRAARSQT